MTLNNLLQINIIKQEHPHNFFNKVVSLLIGHVKLFKWSRSTLYRIRLGTRLPTLERFNLEPQFLQ